MEKVDFIESLLGGIEIMDDSEIVELQKRELSEKMEKRDEKFKSMVPPRYREVQFEGDPKLLTAQRSVVYGSYGAGKTWLGYSIARELYRTLKISSFRVARERDIYNTILANRDRPSVVKEKYHDVGLLVIDEFGKNSQTDASAAEIFNLIDYRYDWQMRTILICNATTPDELRKIVPEAVQDRFVGSTHFLSGKSRRKPE